MSFANLTAASPRSTLILVRHAHTDMAGSFCGQIDPPLSKQGMSQLADLVERLSSRSLTHIFSSDLQRARQTAQAVADAKNLKVEMNVLLREFAFGSWEGLNWDQVVAQDSVYAQHWLDNYPSVPTPGGEQFEDFRERIGNAMTAIAGQVGGGCAAVVTHAGVIRTFLGDVSRRRHLASDFSQCPNVSCWEVWHEAGKWELASESLAAQCVK
jgi:alpha-ribazole phosphatase